MKYRAIFIGGEPATGKTHLMRAFLRTTDDWRTIRPDSLLIAQHSKSLNTTVMGLYTPKAETFEGTDKLSMAAPPQFERFLISEAKNKASRTTILLEGDRLFTGNILTLAGSLHPGETAAIILRASSETKGSRHQRRADTQSSQFLQSRETKISNIVRQISCGVKLAELRHETEADTGRIVRLLLKLCGGTHEET